MKRFKFLLLFISIVSISCAQKKSPRMQTKGTIDGVTVSIDYGAPSVRGRTIWGSLEKYDNVWRAGANENTTIAFDTNVMVGGNTLAAGKYGFFIIPKENNDWVLIFNKKNDAWGAYSYSESEDALRIHLKPEFVTDNQEQLKYSVSENAIEFAWEKARIVIPIKAQ